MTLEHELERRLAARVDGIDAEPDLGWVEAEAGRRHRHRLRYPAAAGALVVLVGGIVAVAAVVDRPVDDPDRFADGAPETTAAAGTVASTTSDTASLPSVAPSGATPGSPTVSGDPAAPFLEGTTEVYRRDMGDREVVVRRSEDSWADHFDLTWRAPTGTADLCTGDHVLFVGDSAIDGPGATAWSPIEEFEDFAGEVAVDQGWSGVTVVRSRGPADEVVLVVDGTEQDRAGLVDGLAVLDTTDLWQSGAEIEPSLVLVADGVPGESLPLGSQHGRANELYQQECTPGPYPSLPLPPAGEQPADPAAADARIREVYAEARDRTVPLAEEDPPTVDDITGIEDAAAEVDAGEMAEVAATAVHTVDELVFTAPDEAWFRYSISTTMGEFGGRFGIARFDGSNWQITRDTICQDLQLAGGTCEPESTPIEPPEPDGWADVLAEYERTSQLYWSWDCLPEPFGPGPEACEPLAATPATTIQTASRATSEAGAGTTGP